MMQRVFGKEKFQRQTGSNPGHLFTTRQVYSSLLICKLGIKTPTLRALSHRTWHRWVLNIEYLSDQFIFFKVRSKWSFICHFPPVLGVFGCMGLELKCSGAGLTRRGGHIPPAPPTDPPHGNMSFLPLQLSCCSLNLYVEPNLL